MSRENDPEWLSQVAIDSLMEAAGEEADLGKAYRNLIMLCVHGLEDWEREMWDE